MAVICPQCSFLKWAVEHHKDWRAGSCYYNIWPSVAIQVAGCHTINRSLAVAKRHSSSLFPIHCGWSRTTVSCAAISHLPFTFLSTIKIRPSTVTPAFVAW